MPERTEQHQLVKIGDTDLRLEAPEQDIRGLDVYDRDGREIGSAEGLYIDTQESRSSSAELAARRALPWRSTL